jgi:hypothetical protein
MLPNSPIGNDELWRGSGFGYNLESYGLTIIDRRVRSFNARIVNPILMEYLHAAREAIFKCHFFGKAMKSGNFSITSIVDNVTHIIDKYS